MRHRSVLGAIVGATLVVSTAFAQDASPPPVLQRTVLELAPATMIAWRDGLRKMAAAAKTANLPAREVGWWALNEGNRTIIVAPASRDALFRNTQVMQKIEKADPAAAKAIREAWQGTQITGVTTEILQQVPDLAYQPASPLPSGAVSGAVTVEYVIAPGQRAAFGEAITAMNKVLADINYPYRRSVSWVRMGAQRMQVTTFIDSREAYFGKNSAWRMTEGTAAREAMGAARRALLKTITGMHMTMANYVDAQSYPPGM